MPFQVCVTRQTDHTYAANSDLPLTQEILKGGQKSPIIVEGLEIVLESVYVTRYETLNKG